MKSYAELKEITDWYRGISPDSDEWPYAVGYAVALLLWMKTQEAAAAEGIEIPKPEELKTDKEKSDWVNSILEKMSQLAEPPATGEPSEEKKDDPT